MDTIFSIDRVRAEAISAAQHNQPPTVACRYPLGSPAARLWMLEYAKHVNRLAAKERARSQAAGDFGGDAA